MASADLRAELECSVCANIYTDPVMLPCGHHFLNACTDCGMDIQESGGYSCPECRELFQDRSALHRNITLPSTEESFLPAQPDQEVFGVLCTQCLDSPVPAVRFCLHCDAYLCDRHRTVHSKEPHHVLADPTTHLQIWKCSAHNELVKYYCINDGSCVCVSCSLAGEHQGHQVVMLDEASEKKKDRLRNILPKLQTKKEQTEERVQSLQEHRRKVDDKAAGDTERVTALFTDLRRRLEDLEERALMEISGQAERTSMSVLEMIQDVEKKKDEQSRKIRHIEELCNMTDPLTVLQDSETGDLFDTEDGDDEDRERHDRLLPDGGDLDVDGILHAGLSDIIPGINVCSPIEEAAYILLDVYTANNNLLISDDRKTVSWSDKKQKQSKVPRRFHDCPQVLSSQRFSSGRHCWEVDVGGSDEWIVGLCYPSIGQLGGHSEIGGNNKSWGLDRSGNEYCVIHDNKEILLPTNPSSNRVRIFVDYEAGRISFYDVCDPIRPLYTFTATFTEPLHAGFAVKRGCIKICAQGRVMSQGGGM